MLFSRSVARTLHRSAVAHAKGGKPAAAPAAAAAAVGTAGSASGGGSAPRRVTLIPGDGIGPECVGAVVDVFHAARAPIEWDLRHVTSSASRLSSMMLDSVMNSLATTGVALKGVVTTPVGRTGHESINMLLRKRADLYASVTVCKTLPGVRTRHEDVDIVVIRENTEGEYSSMEHEVVPGVIESLKVVSRAASLRIAEFAFAYAKRNGRRKVSVATKANIQKKVDGLFLDCCREVRERYPEIEYEEVIVDACCMLLVSNPQRFDVMVMPNLYGNVIGNTAIGLVGGAGVAPGANYGSGASIYESGGRHAALDIAGRNIANPTGMLLSSTLMLRDMGLVEDADTIERAIRDTIIDGRVLTRDVGGKASTAQFTNAIINRIENY
jgi:isocitrate dehydrogenase (NAD+)